MRKNQRTAFIRPNPVAPNILLAYAVCNDYRNYPMHKLINLALAYFLLTASMQNQAQTENPPAQEFERPAIFDSKPYAELGASYEGLTNGYAPWQSQYLDVMLPFKQNGLIYLQLQNVQRFSEVDQSAYLNYAYPMKYGVINIEGGHTQNPQFLSKNLYGAGWNGKLPYSFNYLISGRESSYLDGRTSNQNIGLDRYFSQFRLAYVASYSTLNSQKSGWLNKFQAQWLGEGNNKLGLSYSTGHEPTVVTVGNLTTVDTQQYQLDGLYWLSPDLGLTAAIWHAKQGGYYQRNGGQLGIRMAF